MTMRNIVVLALLLSGSCVAQVTDTIPQPKDHIMNAAVSLEQGGKNLNIGLLLTWVGLGAGATLALIAKENGEDPTTGLIIGGGIAFVGLMFTIDGNSKVSRAGKQLRKAREKGLL